MAGPLGNMPCYFKNAVNQKFLTVFSYFYLTFLYSNTMTLQAVKKNKKNTLLLWIYVLVAKNVEEKKRGKVFSNRCHWSSGSVSGARPWRPCPANRKQLFLIIRWSNENEACLQNKHLCTSQQVHAYANHFLESWCLENGEQKKYQMQETQVRHFNRLLISTSPTVEFI